MEPNPYKFSPSNPRLVEGADRSPKVLYATAAIFLYSLHLYNRRWFRKDGNAVNMLMFAAGSAPASYVYARTLFSSPVEEAAIQNNERERQHWLALVYSYLKTFL